MSSIYNRGTQSNATAQQSYVGQVNPQQIIQAYPYAAAANMSQSQQQQPFNYQMSGIQPQQEIGQPQNRIIMHGQDRDQLKKNLNAAIFMNNQRAQ